MYAGEQTGSSAKAILIGKLHSVAGLEQVRERIAQKLKSDSAHIEDVNQYLYGLGGKQLRPILALLCFQALVPDQSSSNAMPTLPDELIDIAAGIELIHMASLLHDDIIDRADLRRHKPSALVTFGLPATLLTGDYLLVRAYSLCARLDRAIILETESACMALSEGELAETSIALGDHSIESALEVSRKKTGSLFRLACFSAAQLATNDEQHEIAMRHFGESIGLAFQVVDDILDVLGSAAELGKSPGTDIRERKPSIVNLLWLESGSPLANELLLQRSDAKPASADEINAALTELKGSPTLEQAYEIAREFANKARSALESSRQRLAQSNSAFDTLEALVDFVLERMN